MAGQHLSPLDFIKTMAQEEEGEQFMEVYSFGADFLENLPVGIVRRKKQEIIYSNKVAREIFQTLGVSQVCLWLDHHSTNKEIEIGTPHGNLVIHKIQEKDVISYQLEMITQPKEILYQAYRMMSDRLEEFLAHTLEQDNNPTRESLHFHAFHCCLYQQKRNLSYILAQDHLSLVKCNIYQELEKLLEDCNPWIERFGCSVLWDKKSKISALGKIAPLYFQKAMKNILAYGVSLAQEEEKKRIQLSLVHFQDMLYFTIEIPYTRKETPKEDTDFNLQSAIALLERMQSKPLLIQEGKSIRLLLTFSEEQEGFFQLLSPSVSESSAEVQSLYPQEVLSFSQLILQHGTIEDWSDIFQHEIEEA